MSKLRKTTPRLCVWWRGWGKTPPVPNSLPSSQQEVESGWIVTGLTIEHNRSDAMWPQGWVISGHVVPTWFSWNVHFQNLATMPWDTWAKWRGHIVGALVNSASEPRLWVIPVALGFNYVSPKDMLKSNHKYNSECDLIWKKKSHCRCNELGWGHIRVAQMIKNLPVMQETQVPSLGQEDPLEKRMATHCSILAWEIPWTEEPGGLQGSQRVGHDWVTLSLSYQSRRAFSMSSSEMRTPCRQTHQEDGHVKTEAETGVMLPQASEHLAASRSWKIQRRLLPWRLWREHGPWFQIPRLQRCQRLHFCCFEPPHL